MEFNKLSNIKLGHEKSEFYGNVDGLSLQNVFYAENGFFPSCYLFDYNNRTRDSWRVDTDSLLEWLTENGKIYTGKMDIIQYYTKCFDSDIENKDNLTLCVVFDKDLMMRVDKHVNDSYILFSNEKISLAKELSSLIEKFYISPKEEKNIYWRLCCSNGSFYLDKGKIKTPENFDINLHYNDDFIKENNKIMEFIAKDDKSGLVILHGEKGTGKSTYIKNLVSLFPNKKFVYVPASIINLLGEPSFGSYLSTLNNHILVLEDCENIIKDRQFNGGGASAVSLLLNMTDGILSDDLSIKFICTFNDDMKNIDPALLRKGRLVSKYEFKKLSVEKTQILLDNLGNNVKITKPLSLADIFNYNDDDYEPIKKSII